MPSQRLFTSEAPQRMGKLFRICWIGEQKAIRTVTQNLGDTGSGADHDGESRSHRLESRETERVVNSRQHKEVGRSIELTDMLRGRKKRDASRQAALAPNIVQRRVQAYANREHLYLPRKAAERLHQRDQAFATVVAAHVQDNAIPRTDAMRLSDGLTPTKSISRMKRLRIHTVVNHYDFLGVHPVLVHDFILQHAGYRDDSTNRIPREAVLFCRRAQGVVESAIHASV